MTTENAIAAPVNFEQLLRDKIKQIVFAAVPDEQIDKLIKSQYDDLFARKQEYSRTYPSKVENMVEEELKKLIHSKVSERVRAIVEAQWTDENTENVFKEAVKAYTPTALDAFGKELVRNALANFQNSMRNGGY